MKKNKVHPQSLQNLKLGIHANLVFDEEPGSVASAAAVLKSLNDLADPKAKPEELEAHLEVLKRRVGGMSLTRLADERKLETKYLQAGELYVRETGLRTLKLENMSLSVDLLNASGEVGIAWPWSTVEVFRVEGREIDGFVDALKRVFDAVDARFLFGGSGFNTEIYFALALKAVARGGEPPTPNKFLWPLTGLKQSIDESLVRSLPIHRAVRCETGWLLQVFEDLWTGSAVKYAQAAQALGLKSIWEAQAKRS